MESSRPARTPTGTPANGAPAAGKAGRTQPKARPRPDNRSNRPARGRANSVDATPAGSPRQARARSAAALRGYARKAQRRDAVVGGRWPGTVRRTPFVLFVMALLATGLIVSLWLSTAATADSYRLDQARRDARDLSEQVEQLREDVAAMQTAPELAQRARDLGMVPAGEPARLVVQPDGSVVLVGEPTPATAPPPPQLPALAAQPGQQQPAQGQQPPAQAGQPPVGQAAQQPPAGQPPAGQPPGPGGG